VRLLLRSNEYGGSLTEMKTQGVMTRYLLAPSMERDDGVGPTMELGDLEGKLLVISLAINDVIEHEAIAISIWGSEHGSEWGMKPLLAIPEKSYCGVYSTFLNLAKHPEVHYLRAEWKMKRWDKRLSGFLFGLQISVRPMRTQFQAAVA